MLTQQKKDTVVTHLLNEYMETRYQGEHPDIESYLQRCPVECREELKDSIDNFEWLLKKSQYDEIVEYIEDTEFFTKRIQTKLDEISAARKKISAADSFQELFNTLKQLGRIDDLEKNYSSYDLVAIINFIRQQELNLDSVPDAPGLREKVAELLKKERGL